jgi:hypothetical protein
MAKQKDSPNRDVAAKIAALDPDKAEKVANFIERLQAIDNNRQEILTSSEVSAAYEALDDMGKQRITRILAMERGRVERQQEREQGF